MSAGADLAYMISVVLGGLPFIIGAVFIAAWLRRRQWIRLGLFVVASLACAAAFAAWLIVQDRVWMGIDDEYSIQGWWLMPIFGVYFAAALAMVGWLAKRGFLSVRGKARSILTRVRKKRAA